MKAAVIVFDVLLCCGICLCGLGILGMLATLFGPVGPPLVSYDSAEEVDGSSDGGEPDALTEALARRIDGSTVVDDVMAAEQVLGCGCLDVAWPQHACPRCDWRTCLGHAEAHHYCVGDELPRRAAAAPLPPAVAAAVNDAFSAVIGGHDLDELRGVGQNLAKYYLIGNDS